MKSFLRVLAIALPTILFAVPAAADTTTILIRTTAAGGLAFEPNEIRVKAGTPVKIRYLNESPMTHNMIIVKTEADIDLIGEASFNAPDHVPAQHKSRMIAWSPTAAPGKTVEFKFVAPPAGDYFFVCFVDGHFNMMVGTLRSMK